MMKKFGPFADLFAQDLSLLDLMGIQTPVQSPGFSAGPAPGQAVADMLRGLLPDSVAQNGAGNGSGIAGGGIAGGGISEVALFQHGIQYGASGMTFLDGASFARGGAGGGGGGGGSTGGSGYLTTYWAGSANGSAGYDIRIDFKGTGWTTDLQNAFIHTADYLTAVITADIGGDGTYRGVFIDDLYVTAELKAIDGTGGILGQAGPTAVWNATELTAAGSMQFDSADAASFFTSGLWDEIVTHEFMHVLGFGSLWNYGTDPLVSGAQYLGAAGLAAYQEVNPGASYIPVETDGGNGTAGAHWDEQTFGGELMTGWLNSSGNYMSKFSVMSLADLGYQVNYQPYS